MSARTRLLLAFVFVLGSLGTVGAYGWAYDSRLGQHGIALMFDPAEPEPDSTVTDLETLPPAAADVVRTGVRDGSTMTYRDDRDDVATALESLSRYVRVDGETYRVTQVADENMGFLSPIVQLSALLLSMTALGVGVAALRIGTFRPLSIAASLSIPGVALAIDVVVTLLDSMVSFPGSADLPVVPVATGLAVVGVAARNRNWTVALGGFVAVLLGAFFAGVLDGTSLGLLGVFFPGIPIFVLGFVLAGGGQSDGDSVSADVSATST
ncbi:hypothetical protein C440_00615 [Haloferax mucosum ATCC BAA-1512]|uniref:Uncharacterized protein n=1 Tax=Haloferax mucosum ATCC BAA-1512 TaxID=662479 RepID=M0ISL8_9EURY|nr:hypothetical protein [Haloferax mucosum]ELZ98813.1 hypothetical protein C440_00615 [Haloferax mucosum ATCC BAA-1512]